MVLSFIVVFVYLGVYSFLGTFSDSRQTNRLDLSLTLTGHSLIVIKMTTRHSSTTTTNVTGVRFLSLFVCLGLTMVVGIHAFQPTTTAIHPSLVNRQLTFDRALSTHMTTPRRTNGPVLFLTAENSNETPINSMATTAQSNDKLSNFSMPPPPPPPAVKCPDCDMCDGSGRISGGIGAVLDWWPIKAYRPCPNFIERGGFYARSGQGLDEIAFGRDSKYDPNK